MTSTPADGDPDPRLRLPAPAGLCADCAHRRLLVSARGVYLRCMLAATDPRFDRYPRLPVRSCAGYTPTG